jgi:hypothetical protein
MGAPDERKSDIVPDPEHQCGEYSASEMKRRTGRQVRGFVRKFEGGAQKTGPEKRNARSGGIRALHFSAEKRKEGRGMHPSALAGVFAAPAVKH